MSAAESRAEWDAFEAADSRPPTNLPNWRFDSPTSASASVPVPADVVWITPTSARGRGGFERTTLFVGDVVQHRLLPYECAARVVQVKLSCAKFDRGHGPCLVSHAQVRVRVVDDELRTATASLLDEMSWHCADDFVLLTGKKAQEVRLGHASTSAQDLDEGSVS